MPHIVIVEDEKEIGSWLQDVVTEAGLEATWVTTGEELLTIKNEVDLVILDVMLPGLDGFSTGKRWKTQHSDVPILMLSARTAVEDKLEGLSFADDYVPKPFHPEELLARIQILLRRYDRDATQVIDIGQLRISLKDLCIHNRETGGEILLTGKQYAIFRYFLQHANFILTKEQIYEGVWGEPYIEGDKTLMVHIRHLREKLERDPSDPKIIETVRGIGYRVRTR
ncbi:response regulator transcription factor [Bacillus fonticola]|uniref:response regulator transcription factor n=1 Tax=Bacillus fonticola TaxID=2728853 RepID=UPI0014731886|nr:response regulator transcription factor [Bacillus fonticola]